MLSEMKIQEMRNSYSDGDVLNSKKGEKKLHEEVMNRDPKPTRPVRKTNRKKMMGSLIYFTSFHFRLIQLQLVSIYQAL